MVNNPEKEYFGLDYYDLVSCDFGYTIADYSGSPVCYGDVSRIGDHDGYMD